LTATSAAVTITGPTYLVTLSGSGIQGSTGPGYAATSTTSLALASSGSKAFTTQQGLAYTAGARIRATSAGDVTKWMEGVIASYSGTTLTVTMDAKNGTGTFADWNLNLAGEPGAGGGGGSTAPAGTGVVKVVSGAFEDPAALLVDADVSASAAIAWSKVSKSGAVPGDVGAAATSHTHAESDVTGLVSDLAGKAPTTNATITNSSGNTPLILHAGASPDEMFRTEDSSGTPEFVIHPGGDVDAFRVTLRPTSDARALEAHRSSSAATAPIISVWTGQSGEGTPNSQLASWNADGTITAPGFIGPLTGNVTGTATPLAHASSHAAAGADPITISVEPVGSCAIGTLVEPSREA
jgi:hypothetical protein